MRIETLRLQEYETALVDEELVQLVDESFWDSLDIKVNRSPKDTLWRLKAKALSGIARYRTASIDLTVVIEPKMQGADVLFLADHAYGQHRAVLHKPKGARVGINSTYSDPVAALLIWYVDAVADFATRWLRRSYTTRSVTLSGEVRGRFLVSKYVTNSLATGRNTEVPCILTERTIDTPNNRVLKAGLREVFKLATSLAIPAARKAVKNAVISTLPLFAEITDVTVGAREFRATSIRGSERHYAPILQTTSDLLGSRFLGGRTGVSEVGSFLWEMPILFQEALRGILGASNTFTVDTSKRPHAVIHDEFGKQLVSSPIDPDYVLRSGDDVMLFDAKYKQAVRLAKSEEETLVNGKNEEETLVIGKSRSKIKVLRSDIYQMASYRQQKKWLNADVALVYPLVLSSGQPLPEPYEVRGIGDVVHLHFIDVGPNARGNLPAFLKRIRPGKAMDEGMDSSQG